MNRKRRRQQAKIIRLADKREAKKQSQEPGSDPPPLGVSVREEIKSIDKPGRS